MKFICFYINMFFFWFFNKILNIREKIRWECVWLFEGFNCCWGVKDDFCIIDFIYYLVLRVMAFIVDVNVNFFYNKLLIKD